MIQGSAGSGKIRVLWSGLGDDMFKIDEEEWDEEHFTCCEVAGRERTEIGHGFIRVLVTILGTKTDFETVLSARVWWADYDGDFEDVVIES